MRTSVSMLALLAATLLLPAAAPCADTIGVVRALTGGAVVLRNGVELPVTAGFRLQEGDRITTVAGGSLGALMRDNASLSLGPSSSVSLDRFSFSPVRKEYAFLVRVARGTLAYVSGLIGKASPESVSFETPVASLAIRGTRFALRVDE